MTEIVQRGLYLEEFEVGARYLHRPGRTATETDNVLFSSLTMNAQALHLDAAFSATQPFGQRLMNSMWTLATMVGASVSQLTQGTLVAQLGLYDTLPAFILPGLAGVFSVFFLRQFFLSLPIELEEAAYVDGANRLRTFLSVALPLAGPALATLAVITFLAFWNDYLWPLLVTTDPRMMTLPVGLTLLQDTTGITNWGVLMAGTVIVTLPVLAVFLVFQRRIVGGLTAGAVTG